MELAPYEPAERTAPPPHAHYAPSAPLHPLGRGGGGEVARADAPARLAPRAALTPPPAAASAPPADALDDVLQHASPRGTLPAGGTAPLLRAGTTVRARYADGKLYAAVVQGVAPDGSVRVRWTEYGTIDLVAPHDVLPPGARR